MGLREVVPLPLTATTGYQSAANRSEAYRKQMMLRPRWVAYNCMEHKHAKVGMRVVVEGPRVASKRQPRPVPTAEAMMPWEAHLAVMSAKLLCRAKDWLMAARVADAAMHAMFLQTLARPTHAGDVEVVLKGQRRRNPTNHNSNRPKTDIGEHTLTKSSRGQYNTVHQIAKPGPTRHRNEMQHCTTQHICSHTKLSGPRGASVGCLCD